MTSVKFFHSNMVGAPVLSGTAGATIGVLDACLKDGFGTKSVNTLVIASGVATMNVTGSHAAVVGSVVLVAGATPSSLNGEKRVTAITGTSVSFATTEANGSATGTITFKIAALGFTTPFTGTNLRVYRSASVESTQMYLRLDDTGTTTSRVVGYESMTDVNTGVNPFPTVVQVSGGMYWPKSSAASTAARDWVVIGDNRSFIFWANPAASGLGLGVAFGFGDINSNKSGDAYGCAIFGGASDVNNTGSPINGCIGYGMGTSATTNSYIARASTGLGGALLARKIAAYNTAAGYSGTSNYNQNSFVYPNTADNALLVSQVELQVGTSVRGRVAGAFHSPQILNDAFSTRDFIDGTGPFSGKRFMALRAGTPGSSTYGAMFVDVTGPWRS
jgi:hypothetical protein